MDCEFQHYEELLFHLSQTVYNVLLINR